MYDQIDNQKESRPVFCPLAERMAQYIDRFSWLHPPPVMPLLIGFSGGADSLALLLILRQLQWPVHAVHFHHGIRGFAADRDADWCAAFCRQRHIPFTLLHINTPAERRRGESLEEAARRLRLDRWRELAAEGQVVVLGHHADDALENLFLRLARGGNVSGLTGLRPIAEIAGVRLVRPLLTVRRAELEECLWQLGLRDWREDESNQGMEIRRNAVRCEWLPMIRRTVGNDQGLLQSLQALSQDADYLEQAAEAELNKYPMPRLSRLAQVHPALLPRVLRKYVTRGLGRDFILRHQAVERLSRVLQQIPVKTQTLPLGGGVELQLRHDQLRVVDYGQAWPDQPWEWHGQPVLSLGDGEWVLERRFIKSENLPDLRDRAAKTVYFSCRRLPPVLLIRSRRSGDRIVPFGHRKPVKLKDIFNQVGIPTRLRDLVPLVTADEVVIWVPLVKRSAFAPVDTDHGDTLLVCFSCRESPLWCK